MRRTMWETAFFERSKSPPTAEKHRAVEVAFAAWAERNRADARERIVFDGFAGSGRFSAPARGAAGAHEALGSPLLLLQWLRSQPGAARWRLVLAEKSAVNFSRLCASVGELLEQPAGAAYALGGVSIEVHHTSFERCAGNLLAAAAEGPIFSFVDPYGCDGVRFATLSALAARGDLVVHLASGAIYTKLVTSSGASPKQARRMDRLLGGVVPWSALRDRAPSLDPGRARRLLAEVLVRGLERDHAGLHARLTPLRRGDAFVVHTARDPR